MLQYLDQSDSQADPEDDPDVGEQPALHAGSAALNTNTGVSPDHSDGTENRRQDRKLCLPRRRRASRGSEPHRSRCRRSFLWPARCSGRSRGTAAGSCWRSPCSRSSPDDRSSRSTPSTEPEHTRIISTLHHPAAPPAAEHESDLRSERPTHIPLDEVPGLLRGRVAAGIVVQNFSDDLWHLLVQLKPNRWNKRLVTLKYKLTCLRGNSFNLS